MKDITKGNLSKNFILYAIPVIISGMVYGPIFGAVVGILSDIISCLISPNPSLNPIIMLGAATIGALSGVIPLPSAEFSPLTITASIFFSLFIFGKTDCKYLQPIEPQTSPIAKIRIFI